MGVEGHLGHGRRAADRAGGRASCPTLPIGPPRLVEVNMDIDDTRKDVQSAGIDLLARRARDLGETSTICPVADRDVRDADAIGCHDRATAHEKVESRHRGFSSASASRNRSSTSIAAATSLRRHRLCRVMADAAGAADEEHGDRHDLGHHHGVVPGTGGEPLDRQARGRDCLCQPGRERGVTGDGGMIPCDAPFDA